MKVADEDYRLHTQADRFYFKSPHSECKVSNGDPDVEYVSDDTGPNGNTCRYFAETFWANAMDERRSIEAEFKYLSSSLRAAEGNLQQISQSRNLTIGLAHLGFVVIIASVAGICAIRLRGAADVVDQKSILFVSVIIAQFTLVSLLFNLDKFSGANVISLATAIIGTGIGAFSLQRQRNGRVGQTGTSPLVRTATRRKDAK